MSSASDRVAAGHAALKNGDWASAEASFRLALNQEELAEALYGLGVALWWRGDMRGTLAHLERAYLAFRNRPDPVYAAACALRIGFHYRAHLANASAANGWLARGARLIEEHHVDLLRGELLLMQAYHADDPHVAVGRARDALDAARRSGDRDLELCGLSMLGAALVECGENTRGFALLDEAMAGCLGGEAANPETVVFASCTTLVSCARCAQFERATEWIRAADRFIERYGCPFFYAECRTIYGTLLFATGQWTQSENELTTAIRLAQDSVPAYHAEALATLARLRLAQGRLEEAERLVAGFEGHHAVIPVLARCQLAAGNPALASATVQQRLDVLGDDRLESAPLLEVIAEADLAGGNHESARQRGTALASLGARLGCAVVEAYGERVLGCTLLRVDATQARRHLDRTVQTFVRLNMPYETARTRSMLANALKETQSNLAETEARAALAIFEDLGANADADATASLLRQLGVRAARTGPKRLGTLTKREKEVLGLLGQGLSNPEIGRRLFVSRKTVEHHVAHILSKLQLRSRAEAAAEAVRRLEKPAEK